MKMADMKTKTSSFPLFRLSEVSVINPSSLMLADGVWNKWKSKSPYCQWWIITCLLLWDNFNHSCLCCLYAYNKVNIVLWHVLCKGAPAVF